VVQNLVWRTFRRPRWRDQLGSKVGKGVLISSKTRQNHRCSGFNTFSIQPISAAIVSNRMQDGELNPLMELLQAVGPGERAHRSRLQKPGPAGIVVSITYWILQHSGQPRPFSGLNL
jgi:hypothetical protein